MNEVQALAFVRAMPKIELHVHLEGATTAETIWTMAERNGIALPAERPEDLRTFFQYRDFDHFVEAYYAATGTMQTLDDWQLMIDRFMAQQAAQNIVYSEVFLSASHHYARHNQRDWIAALRDAMQCGQEQHGVRIAFIPDISRESPDTQQPVLEFVTEAHAAGVALGMGIGGPEVGFPPEMYTDVFAEARERGMHVVAHAGETEGANSIRGALQSLGAERIGHGIRALEDPSLVEWLAEAQTPIEVCPTSNYCTAVVAKGENHPIHAMAKAGLNVCVNSDDPALFNCTLTSEYELLLSQGATVHQLWQWNMNALESSFLSPGEKAHLRSQFEAFANTHQLPQIERESELERA